MKRVLFILTLLILFVYLTPINANAQRGCCSWHGGIDYCDSDSGRYVCNDGTYSPTCTCGDDTYIAPAPKINVLDSVTGYPTFVSNSDGSTHNVTFDWTDAVGATAYSVTMNKIKGGDPGPQADTYASSYTFSNMKPGFYYVNLKALVGGSWTNTSYWDVTVPAWKESPAYVYQATQPEPTAVALATTVPNVFENNPTTGLFIAGVVFFLILALMQWGLKTIVTRVFQAIYLIIVLVILSLVLGGILWTVANFVMNLAYDGYDSTELSVMPFFVGAAVICSIFLLFAWLDRVSSETPKVLK